MHMYKTRSTECRTAQTADENHESKTAEQQSNGAADAKKIWSPFSFVL